jgi:hypothetical protein
MNHPFINQEDQVRATLKVLADYDRPRESKTPAHAIYARHRPQKWNFGTTLGAIGLAAAAVVVALLMRPTPTLPEPRPPAPPAAFNTPIEVVKPEPAPRPAKRVARIAPKQQPREVVTEFFPLMDVPPPFERGQLLRVVVPAATMRTVGLPVNPDRMSERVQADVLVGEEGMARAIRFVSYEQ